MVVAGRVTHHIVCEETLSYGEEIPAAGHSYDEWIVIDQKLQVFFYFTIYVDTEEFQIMKNLGL